MLKYLYIFRHNYGYLKFLFSSTNDIFYHSVTTKQKFNYYYQRKQNLNLISCGFDLLCLPPPPNSIYVPSDLRLKKLRFLSLRTARAKADI